MAADNARDAIAEFVVQGNLRDVQASDKLPDARRSELQARLANLREATAEIPDASTADVSDFRAAVAEREEQAKQISIAGKDVPRWNTNNPVMKQVYRAHDAVAGLPVPGGIGVMVLVIALFFFILIPATTTGETRALLLWEVLLGKKQVTDSSTLPVVTGSGIVPNGSTPGGIAPTAGPTPTPNGQFGPTANEVFLGMPGVLE